MNSKYPTYNELIRKMCFGDFEIVSMFGKDVPVYIADRNAPPKSGGEIITEMIADSDCEDAKRGYRSEKYAQSHLFFELGRLATATRNVAVRASALSLKVGQILKRNNEHG